MTAILSPMQQAELDWWKNYAFSPTARERMHALYGARYYEAFPEFFMRPVSRVVEIGSGPFPVLSTMMVNGPSLAVDTLINEYRELGIMDNSVTAISSVEMAKDEEAEIVLLLNVLDHTPEPEFLVGHARRMLKKGGHALLFVHLDQEDDKHRKVSVEDVGKWFKGWICQRASIKFTPFDPPAFMGVYKRR